MKLLCVCPIGIGNYLMCYPAFYALKRRRPDMPMHMLALRQGIAALAQGDPLWNGVETLDPDKMKGDIAGQAAAVFRLRSARFDACLNFFPSNTWQYHALPLLGGIRRRYGFRYERKRLSSLSFLGTDLVAVDPALHDVRQNLRLAGFFLNEDLSSEPIVFPRQFGSEEERWAEDFLRPVAGGSRVIAIHPGSSAEHGMDAKRWPPERFAALADRACRMLGAHAVIIGSGDESAVKHAVKASMREPSLEIEPVPLKKTAALLSKCACCIANDSGIMHMAACLGVPTAGIFGPTDEKRNGPWGEKNLLIRKPMPGFPVWTAKNVGDRWLPPGMNPMASLNALSAEEAWEQMRPWLEKI
ncbi:MAG TPA: glycosyltransferase family 9 protein [Chitinivibrionales bacterium]|nr:glycosyltransferase family 9 protein [Chitinivibrionales bacterium]